MIGFTELRNANFLMSKVDFFFHRLVLVSDELIFLASEYKIFTSFYQFSK